jgi:parallel beta-helix repeat protein
MDERIVSILITVVILLSICSMQIPHEDEPEFSSFPFICSDIAASVVVSSDADFLLQGFTGNGSEANPYTLTNVEIVTDGTAINISNTQSHFVITNCTIRGNISITTYGISLYNCSNGRLSDLQIMQKLTGIRVSYCYDCTLQNVTVTQCEVGIDVTNIENITLQDNTLSNGVTGLRIGNSMYSVVGNNSIYANEDTGMILFGTAYQTAIVSNVVEGCSSPDCVGILLDNCLDWYVEGNILSGHATGIEIQSGQSCNVTGNAITNSTLGLWAIGSAQCAIVGNRVSRIESGLRIFSCENMSIESNEVQYAALDGIYLYDSEECFVTGNALNGCGLVLEGSDIVAMQHSVLNNVVNGNPLGYYFGLNSKTISEPELGQLILVNCTDVLVQSGSYSNCTIGVIMGFSSQCQVTNAVIANNSFFGAYILSSSECRIGSTAFSHNSGSSLGALASGLLISSSEDTRIIRNDFSKNEGNGITLLNSNRTYVTNNGICNNSGYGIHITSGCNNLIFGNAIGWNELGNAYDQGESNQWDDGASIGNWWSDYAGDGQYTIPGTAGSIDRYPVRLETGECIHPIDQITQRNQLLLLGAVSVACVIVLLVLLRRRRQYVIE